MKAGPQTGRQADRQTGRQADRQTGRQADRQTDRLADRQTGRQADMQTDRQADRQTGRKAGRQTEKQIIQNGKKILLPELSNVKINHNRKSWVFNNEIVIEFEIISVSAKYSYRALPGIQEGTFSS